MKPASLSCAAAHDKACVFLVETIQSHQAKGACEVSVTLAVNGVAVRVQRIDPDSGRQQVWQEIREDSDLIGM